MSYITKLIKKFIAMSIPQDPFMLLSFVNMKLRDNDYRDLEDLCVDIGCNPDEIDQKLKAAGFEYNPVLNQYR